MITPPKLNPGDTIGFVSPSAGLAPFAMHRIEQAKQVLEGLGYHVKIGKHALLNSGHVSASAEDRAADLNEMFADPEIKLIMSTIGGNHSNQILKLLDYDAIKKNPKMFIGYSDNTVLHYALQAKTGLATYYGPCAMTQFGEYPEILPYTLDYFNKALREANAGFEIRPSETWTDEILNWFAKEDRSRARQLQTNSGHEWLAAGKASGPILGGAIPSINHLAGTEYWLDPTGSIFFIDIPEGHDIMEGLSISEVDSYLADLENLGVFTAIKGLVIGRPYRYSDDQVSQLKSLIMKYMGKNKCPILYNVNIGHVDPIITVRYGSIVELDSSSNSFKVLD
jgi:muramoyltetrapeptide carboxypeptidase LdcA involved in peptidoglycan recycling